MVVIQFVAMKQLVFFFVSIKKNKKKKRIEKGAKNKKIYVSMDLIVTTEYCMQLNNNNNKNMNIELRSCFTKDYIRSEILQLTFISLILVAVNDFQKIHILQCI
jgi:hypothetical protein